MTTVLYNPLSCIEGRRRLPLALLAIGSRLADERYVIVDGNVRGAPAVEDARAALRAGPGAPVVAMSVMPGQQLASAVRDTAWLRAQVPGLTVVWGGYFPTLHAETVLRSPLVDFAVRGQGEETFVELLETLERGRGLAGIAGLSWKDAEGIHHNPDRSLAPLAAFPAFPYHKAGDMEEYVIRTWLGERTLCHVTSRGCPFPCNFCAIQEVYGRRWLAEEPERVAAVVERFVREWRADSVEFFDANFMAAEARALAIAERLERFSLAWWCQARPDTMAAYADATWARLRKSGLRMVFFGAESGAGDVLARMEKRLTREQVLACARRSHEHGIVPEFSFVLGSAPDPQRELDETTDLFYRLKAVAPESEILIFVYTPVPQAGASFAGARERGFAFPETLEDWTSPRWMRFMSMKDPQTPWLPPEVQERIRNLELVVKSRFPTATDIRFTAPWRVLLRSLAAWRWRTRTFARPLELKLVHRLVRLRSPELQGFDAPPARRHRPPARRAS